MSQILRPGLAATLFPNQRFSPAFQAHFLALLSKLNHPVPQQVTTTKRMTYSCMSSTFIPVSPQPLQSSLHLKLHVLGCEGVTSHCEPPDSLGGHLHYNRVIGW